MDNDFKQAVLDGERLLAELQGRHAEAEGAVAAIVERRKPLALAAAMGDETSRKGLARLADEERSAEMRLRDLGFAIDAARIQLDQAKARAAIAESATRREECAGFAATALDAAVAMDNAARALVEAQRRLVAAHRGMAATGIIASGLLNQLIYRASATRALVHWGFSTFTDLPRLGDPLGNQSFEQLVSGVVGLARTTNRKAA